MPAFDCLNIVGATVAVNEGRGERPVVERDVLEITALKILTYLKNNPEAKDPIEGVVEYWIKQANKEYTQIRVDKVLRDLVKKGVVETFESGGREIYKLNQGRSKEVSALLELLAPEVV